MSTNKAEKNKDNFSYYQLCKLIITLASKFRVNMPGFPKIPISRNGSSVTGFIYSDTVQR